MLLCLCACGQKNSKDFKVCPTVHSANVDIKSLCLCAIAPLCLAPRKSKIAKQVPARCGQLVDLRLKSDRHLSAFILLCLFASVFLFCVGCSSSFLHCSSSFLHCSSSSVHCSSSFLHCSQRSSAPRFALTSDSSPPRAPLMVKSIKRATFLQDRALQEARGLDDRSDANCQCTHMCPPRAAKLPVPRPAGWFVLAFACWTPHRSHAAG